ncbi:MAG: Flp pilus assembly complex ATPase component TadA [Lentisphaeria bacterium]|nr:Flp pilus assembly complex ATPase component TadA [Lentisphaeria bacterium]
MARDSDYIIYLLSENGLLTDEQIKTAKQFVIDAGRKVDMVDAIKALKYISEEDLQSILAQEYGLEIMDLSAYVLPHEVVDAIPPEVAVNYGVVPVMKHNDSITIAMSDPTDMGKLDSLRYLLGCDVEAVIAPAAQIENLLDQHYRTLTEHVERLLGEMGSDTSLNFSSLPTTNEEDVTGINDDDAPVIKLVTMLIANAYKMRASDIHMEPMEKYYRIRYRIDGALQEVEAPPKYMQPSLTSRLKIMARLDISEKRIPQDGRIQMRMDGVDIDLRVSSVPTVHGESIVMRILDKASIMLDVPRLGFYADDLELVTKIISLPDGIFLVTGPTGSGKTTSLYAFLNTINTVARKIITVEDPVEYQLEGINQVQVLREVNLTFAAALRSMLRQAPNIIMIGEIRDYETAEIAIQAALTGHLVFSTLHTNDAPSSVTRLIDMGVKPFLVASSVRAIMAQRLVRRVCKNCMEPYKPSPDEIRLLHLDKDYLDSANLVHGRGCPTCGGTGYKGRMGIYEIFLITEDMQYLIYNKESSDKLRAAARQSGMRTLREDGLRKAAAGTTTVSEVLAVTVGDEE